MCFFRNETRNQTFWTNFYYRRWRIFALYNHRSWAKDHVFMHLGFTVVHRLNTLESMMQLILKVFWSEPAAFRFTAERRRARVEVCLDKRRGARAFPQRCHHCRPFSVALSLVEKLAAIEACGHRFFWNWLTTESCNQDLVYQSTTSALVILT